MATSTKDARALQGSVAADAARDEARLVTALRAGDQSAFARFVADYQNAVYGLALRLVRDREDARDIAQEVLLKAFRRIPESEGELHLWAWLYRVTANACWDHLRAARRRPVTSHELREESLPPSTDGEAQAELAYLFSASLETLPPRQQAALLLKDVHGLSHSDIAATLDISRGSSEVLLFRARHSFRHAFRRMSAVDQGRPVCHFAEQAAAASVGGRLTEARSRRVMEHARTCPNCRKVVEGWGGTRGVGLALAFPLVAAPQLFGSHAAAATAASATVPLGTAASVAAAAAGGIAAKLAGGGLAKVAVVTLAATSMATSGGAVAYNAATDGGGQRPSAVASANAQHLAKAAASATSPGAHPAVAGQGRRRPAASRVGWLPSVAPGRAHEAARVATLRGRHPGLFVPSHSFAWVAARAGRAARATLGGGLHGALTATASSRPDLSRAASSIAARGSDARPAASRSAPTGVTVRPPATPGRATGSALTSDAHPQPLRVAHPKRSSSAAAHFKKAAPQVKKPGTHRGEMAGEE
jgi:RNA polymerase sigma-70 factor (ECF subfamily)